MSFLVLALFVVAGLALAKLAPFAKFALWSLIVTALYAAYLALTTHAVLGALGRAVLGFVVLQIGYVAGTALVTAFDRRRDAAPGVENGKPSADARVKFGDRELRR